LECTDDKSLSKSERKKIQIKKALKATKAAKLVKMADKISNNKGLLTSAPK
jgi:guanosine-3',5'-bis(diphosphate) 3'-pyrophosphohydrolase